MLLFINSFPSRILSRRASQYRRAPLTLFGSPPSNALNDPMAFSNIEYYISGNGITTPSSSSESGSTTEESASIEAPSRRDVGHRSHKPCEPHLQGTKRTGEFCIHDWSVWL
jgi:hypothetical protein